MEEIASSIERFGRYANWSGSSVLGKLVLMSLSKSKDLMFFPLCSSSLEDRTVLLLLTHLVS